MIYGITVESILTGALVFMRVSSILFALPFFGDSPTPLQVRILLSVAITLVVLMILPAGWLNTFPSDAIEFATLVVREICIGLFMGFIGRLAFDALIMAASFIGYQMGFGVSDLFLPDAGMQMNSFTAFHRAIMLLIFLSLNLHHMYLDAIFRSFATIPAGGALPTGDMGAFVVHATSDIFRIAVQLSAPILVALMFANTALGLMARTVPQMNVFTMSFPIGFFLGLFVYMGCLPFFPEWADSHFSLAQMQILQTIKGLSP